MRLRSSSPWQRPPVPKALAQRVDAAWRSRESRARWERQCCPRSLARLQADWVDAFYTICYAKPEVEAVTCEDFADPSFLPQGGMVHEDLRPKESYRRLKGLLNGWRVGDAVGLACVHTPATPAWSNCVSSSQALSRPRGPTMPIPSKPLSQHSGGRPAARMSAAFDQLSLSATARTRAAARAP